MDIDFWYILSIVISILIGLGIYYVYQKVDSEKVDAVFGTVKAIYDRYGERIKHDNPQLYEELDNAMKKLEEAMTDSEISIMEAFMIAQSFLPLANRLTRYIKEHYEG